MDVQYNWILNWSITLMASQHLLGGLRSYFIRRTEIKFIELEMALRPKFRSIFHQGSRHFSTPSILKPKSDNNQLTSRRKSFIALSSLLTQKNPERIIDICRTALLSPDSHLDRAAHSTAISKLKDLNHFDGIRDLLEEFKTRPDMKSERYISYIFTLYGKAGMLNDAVETFEEMHERGIERNVKTLNSLLFTCSLAKDFKEMKRIYVEFPRLYRISPNLDTYNWMIKGYSMCGETSLAYKILDDIRREGFKPVGRTFCGMLARFYKEEKSEDVEKVLVMMEEHGLRDKITTYNTRIQSLCKLRKSKDAKTLCEEMLSKRTKRCYPNAFTYNHLILGFCKEGDLEEAKSLYERSVKSGIKPDCESYFTLLYFLCQRSDFEAALEICNACMKRGLVPNMLTLELLVDGLVSISKVNEARQLITELKDSFSRNAGKWIELDGRLAE